MSKGIKGFQIEKGWFKKGRKPNPIWVYKKISKKMKGHKVSEKTRKKISKANKRNYLLNPEKSWKMLIFVKNYGT